jgi:phospholipid transport system transporter-binding protein
MQLPEHATLEQAAGLAALLPAELAKGEGPFQIDASALKAYDTSTVALLMQAHRLAQAAGRPFSVAGAPAQLAQLASLYGVEELLSLSPSSAAPGPRASGA